MSDKQQIEYKSFNGHEYSAYSNNAIFMAIFFCVIAIFGATIVFADSYDNDIWFILATGEQIVENGIIYENPFSIYEGLNIVVQQWIPCVVSYLVFQQFGFIGLGVLALVLYGFVLVSLYKTCRVLRDNDFGGEIILLAMILGLWALSSYMTMRPHMYTMLAYIWIVYFLERYRRSNNNGSLIPLPIICAIHVNFQSALAPFDIVIMACYAIPDFSRLFKSKRDDESNPNKSDEEVNHSMSSGIIFADSAYRRLPILIVIAISALALLLNPYTLDGALYLFNSYGAANYGSIIREMLPFDITSSITSLVTALTVVVTLVCAIRLSNRQVNLPITLLIAGTFVMTIMQTRNKWLLTLFCIMLIVWLTRSKRIRLLGNLSGSGPIALILASAGLIASIAICIINAPKLESLPINSQNTPVAAMDYLDDIEADKDTTRVFCFFNTGPYIEYRGYKVSMDSRPELWNTGISKGEKDYYFEYVDMASGDLFIDDYLEQYDFDVFVVPNDDSSIAYFRSDISFKEIPSGSDYTAFIRRDITSMNPAE